MTIGEQVQRSADVAVTVALSRSSRGRFPYGTAVRVTLRRPVPLETALESGRHRGRRTATSRRSALVAEAVAVDPRELGDAVPHVDAALAEAAMARFDGLDDHPFPTCFVCGPQRHLDDGLGLYAGAVGPVNRRERQPCSGPDRPHPAGGRHRPGRHHRSGDRLGRAGLPRRVDAGPARPPSGAGPDDGRGAGHAGGRRALRRRRATRRPGRRKGFTRTTAYGADGRELGRAAAVWIEIQQ